MGLRRKLGILADAAKHDASPTSPASARTSAAPPPTGRASLSPRQLELLAHA